MKHKEAFKIVLIGVEFEENLSLRYLAGSLLAAGYQQVEIQPYNSILEAEEIATAIIRNNPDLVGISMAFQTRAVEDMALVQLLRKRGFTGHITTGGQFATLHYAEIFRDCPGLSSLVRFEAEQAMVQLADTLRTAGDLSKVPSLIWQDENQQLQENNNAVTPGDINDLPLPVRKPVRSEYLGFRTVHMLGSRGCHATCKYCCVSALTQERTKASREAGGSTALPGTRRRTASNVAAEIAQLYFEQNIRIFEFQDDNWIHPKIETAVAYFTELKAELERLGVGQIGLTLKTRADSVQPEIIKALKAIGLIRVFVGIESGTQNLLTKLGRKSRDNVSLQALQILQEYQVPAYFNALLFGPDLRLDELEPELQFLEQCTTFPFEIVEVVIYGKTGLYLSLNLEKRLFGNYLDYDYEYLDAQTRYIYQLLTKLDTRHFGVYSPVKMAADLGFNLGILQVFYPGEFASAMAEKVADLTRKINEDQVRIIRKAAVFALKNLPFKQAKKELIAETVARDLCFYQEIIELQLEMEQYVQNMNPGSAITAYYRTGGVVQSALIAGLFLMTLGAAQAQQQPGFSDKELKREYANLMRDFDSGKWKKLSKEIRNRKAPILPPFYRAHREIDSVFARNLNAEKVKQIKDNEALLGKKVNKLKRQRIQDDYKRLTDLIKEQNPKIKIATSLTYYVDQNQQVRDIGLATRNKNVREAFTPELKSTILEILRNKEFYTYEVQDQLSKYSYKKHPHKFRRFKTKIKRYYRRHFKKHQRRGPMD